MGKNPPAMQETQETQVQSLGWESPQDKEMVAHYSILAWKTSWTEEPDRLQSKGSQRFGHDLLRRLSEKWGLYLSLNPG